jgi:cell division septation protein DedD
MKQTRQRGGTILGFIIGVVVGLGSALAVAVYVTKVPVPFMTGKAPSRAVDSDAAESKKNKDWDPNTPLHGKNPAKPTAPVVTGVLGNPEPAAVNNGTGAAAGITPPVPVAVAPLPLPGPTSPPVAPPKPAEPRIAAPAASADPLGDLARARARAPAPAAATAVAVAPPSLGPAADPFEYFVQAGAFRTPEDAEGQRAKLAMMGMEARVTEREQSGRTVYRVRMGPFNKKEEAERTKDRLDNIGTETALVRVQR